VTRFRLREVTADDHAWLVELHNDPAVLRNITDPKPITLEQHLAWWRSLQGDARQVRLIFTVDAERAGFAKFYNIDRVNSNCVLGADIHRAHRGRGYANAMWTLMLDRVFLDLGLHRASLTTAAYNEIGLRVYRRLGFLEEGHLVESLFRDDKFHDQVCMYILCSDWRTRRRCYS